MSHKRRKQDVAPGTPGRIDAIGQERDAQGRLLPKTPRPEDEARMAEIVARREKAIEAGVNWRPTQEEWDAVVTEAHHMDRIGHSVPVIAHALKLPESNVRRAVAAGRRAELSPEDQAELSEYAEVTYQEIIDVAIATGDLEEARKTVDSMLKARGLMAPNGQQQGVQINIADRETISADIQEWIEQQDEELPDAAPGEPQAPQEDREGRAPVNPKDPAEVQG